MSLRGCRYLQKADYQQLHQSLDSPSRNTSGNSISQWNGASGGSASRNSSSHALGIALTVSAYEQHRRIPCASPRAPLACVPLKERCQPGDPRSEADLRRAQARPHGP